MKYISKKVIRGTTYYYIQYQGQAKNLGTSLPTDLNNELVQFFSKISKILYSNIPEKTKKEFRFGSLETLERMHASHIVLNHDLFKKKHDDFYEVFIKLFTYHSNHAEGSKITKKEIDNFAKKKIKKPKTKTDKEIFNSFLAFNYAISNEMKWSMKSIKTIHELLLNGLDPIIAGKWKNENNVAPGSQPTIEWKKIPHEMKKIIEWLKSEIKKKTYPPKLALRFYVRFEHIHPFLDGNGRVGRILLNAILHKFNYPPVIFFSENHQEHSAGIQYALRGRWGKMNKHFLNQVKKTNDNLVKKLFNEYKS